MVRTSFFSMELHNPANRLVMNAPNPLSWNVADEYGVLSRMVDSVGGNPADQTNQTMFVQAVRLWSNFADGLVFGEDPVVPVQISTPTFALWEGDLMPGDILPTDYISCQFTTLNEWIPVEKPIPRNKRRGPPGSNGYPLGKIFSGGSYFLTAGVSPAFNTAKVIFCFQALISCSYK